MAATKVNYDLLSYLPEHLETVKGQDILVDEYGMGAFSMVVVENMEMKDVQKLEEKFEQVNHVKEVLWYDDVADISVPVEMIPEKLRKAFYNGDATMMLVLFDNTTSSDDSMEAIEDLRKIAERAVLHRRYDRCCYRYQKRSIKSCRFTLSSPQF